ncbi:hypothetical protein MKX01_008270, partial [Papaver californicum]
MDPTPSTPNFMPRMTPTRICIETKVANILTSPVITADIRDASSPKPIVLKRTGLRPVSWLQDVPPWMFNFLCCFTCLDKVLKFFFDFFISTDFLQHSFSLLL